MNPAYLSFVIPLLLLVGGLFQFWQASRLVNDSSDEDAGSDETFEIELGPQDFDSTLSGRRVLVVPIVQGRGVYLVETEAGLQLPSGQVGTDETLTQATARIARETVGVIGKIDFSTYVGHQQEEDGVRHQSVKLKLYVTEELSPEELGGGSTRHLLALDALVLFLTDIRCLDALNDQVGIPQMNPDSPRKAS